jgi:hypothetical protein
MTEKVGKDKVRYSGLLHVAAVHERQEPLMQCVPRQSHGNEGRAFIVDHKRILIPLLDDVECEKLRHYLDEHLALAA